MTSMRLIHRILCGLALLSCIKDAQSAVLECPAPGGAPLVVDVGTKARQSVRINRSQRGTVCGLYRVLAAKPGVSVSSFSSSSDSSQYTLEPVARSFERKKWQTVPGPYTRKVSVKKCGAVNSACRIIFRVRREDNPADFAYVLLTTSHDLKDKREMRARFLQQATFGPTKADLDNWETNFGPSTDITSYENYLVDQFRNQPMTLNREYFRSHLDWSMRDEAVENGSIAPRDPCAQYSRWRDYAITGDDYAKKFDVTEILVDGVNKYLITVEREPRTVVDTFSSTDGAYAGPGSYAFCFSMGEGIGETIRFQKEVGSVCKILNNPKIYLPSQVVNDHTLALRYIDLPAMTSFEAIDGVFAESRQLWKVGTSYRLLEAMNDPVCDTFQTTEDQIDYRNIVGKVAGSDDMFHYDGYGQVEENSITNPLSDGGLSKLKFANVGANGRKITCANVAMDFTNIDGCRLSMSEACVSNAHSRHNNDVPMTAEATVVCGSDGEVANNPNLPKEQTNMFRMWETANGVFYQGYGNQKSNLWAMVALEAPDQLRQRVAWALSQILVVTPNQIDESRNLNEPFIKYYDIFVRNAFGNYRDVLKEVSYSPMMAEMLSYLESRSSAYVLRVEERVSRPDENYAREIMQLFTMGLEMLRPDGSVIQVDGAPIATYENSDIQNFARAWTGFRRQYLRSNYEGYWSTSNRIDPMPLEGHRRDQFPKMDLFKGFIGDTYPLCIEEPQKMFLRKGATYRLIGSHTLATQHYEHPYWRGSSKLLRLNLESQSNLLDKLCNRDPQTGLCDYKPQVVLDEKLICYNNECTVDNVRMVRVSENPNIFYEYLKPPCIDFAFSSPDNLAKIVDHQRNAMCLDKKINDAALPSCCQTAGQAAQSKCMFSMERTSYETSEKRCVAEGSSMCDYPNHYFPETHCNFSSNGKQHYRTFAWNQGSCSIQAKVGVDGVVALVHKPNLNINSGLAENKKHQVWPMVNEDNTNYFKVNWETVDGFPNASNNWANGACSNITSTESICDLTIRKRKMFKARPSLSEVLDGRLTVGSHNPDIFDDGTYILSAVSTEDVQVYYPPGRATYTRQTVFGVTKNGKKIFLKNYIPKVKVAVPPGTNSTFRFRNPPHFMSLVTPESRDAHYETDAVIDNYFYHPNTPTFISIRLLQRFGFSNASPRHISIVSNAFKTGFYKKVQTHGDGKYGNLEATIAAILLDREARRVPLDADPASGSMREPILKFLGFMRSMEFERASNAPEMKLRDLQIKIGQHVHNTPNVFSFFLPDYAAPGQITAAKLASPEAQVTNAPTIIGFLNGMYSLIDGGLSLCYGGFGEQTLHCPNAFQNPDKNSHGQITYTPTSSTAAGVVDELAVLLTGGRLNSSARTKIENAYTARLSTSNAKKARNYALKLMISTPEFNSLNAFIEKGQNRIDPPDPIPSPKNYKAIVFVNLHGGMDGFQMLVPMDGCTQPSTGAQYDLFANYQKARGEIALRKSSLNPIDVDNQVCTKFGLHPKLTGLKTMYDAKELSFIANMGILQQPGVTKGNWRKKHDQTSLFSHNTQTEETGKVDIFNNYAGIGVGGRIVDELTDSGYSTGAISVSGSAPPVVSKTTPLLVVNPHGFEKFNPNPGTENIKSDLKEVNGVSTAGSTFYGEAWSNSLLQALSENELLYQKYTDADPGAAFPSSHIGRQLSAVSKLVATKDDRGKDRDFFYLEKPGWDMHFDIEVPLNNQFDEISLGLSTFREAMIAQQKWEDVTVVIVSEFARTLMGNTGNGSDHAWGGNFLIASGGLDGGKVLGEFPDTLTNDGDLIFAPGIVIPTLPWESLWDPVARWFGVGADALDRVLPNRAPFTDILLKMEDIFKP